MRNCNNCPSRQNSIQST